MTILRRQAVQSLLSHELSLIRSCIVGAWGDYLRYPLDLRQSHTPRSRASLVHDHTVERARSIFDGRLGAACMDISGLFILLLHDAVALRFKKLDDGFQASNIPTQQSLEFVRQQLELPGVPTITSVQAGYRLNRLQTEIDGVYLTCPRNGGNYWILDITECVSGSVVSFTGGNDSEQQRRSRFRPRDDETQGTGEENDGNNS